MKPGLAKVLAAYQELGMKIDLSDFDFRLQAQKVAYLLQKLGVDIPYPFTLYVRGTYAPQLTKDLFENEEGPKARPRRDTLTKRDLEAIAHFKKHIELRSSQLEVAATYHFLRYIDGLPEDDSIRKLKDLKPFIPEREVVVGISRIKQLFPQASAKDIEDLRAEMEPWDEATRRSDRS